MTTFAELEEVEHPYFNDIEAVLKDYVESGAAIYYKVVRNIIKRVALSELEKLVLIHLAKNGKNKQTLSHQFPSAKEYEKLEQFLINSYKQPQ